ncbi:MAG: DNA translocase FtsK, partial [Beijerinckiaceae bacterium]|nr:DNA translocase FtsK [Beijerinckiaceae bacterium]
MRHSGLHTSAQEIAAEAFSDDAPELPTEQGGPVYVRSRANPLALVKPGEVPAAPPPPEPPQVRFWRTPNRLIGSVWARGAGAEAPLPEWESDVGAIEAEPRVDMPGHPTFEEAVSEELHEPAPLTPFDLISDHAFWEVVAAEVAEDETGRAAAAPRTEAPAAAMPRPARPSEPVVARPPVRSAARKAEPQHATPVRAVAMRPAAQAMVTPVAPAPLPAPAPIAEAVSAGPARGVVVTRRARAEMAVPEPVAVPVAAPAPERAEIRVAPPAPFELPDIAILGEPPAVETAIPTEVLQQNAGFLEGVLEDFNVRGEIVQACPGPVVTLYELEPAPGTKSSRVISLADDIARSMSAISARVAVIPGKN